MLLLGVYTRVVAFALLPVLLGALWVHAGNGWLFSAPNGGWEYPAFLALVSVVVGLLGNGAFAVQPRRRVAIDANASLQRVG
jgi:putative oxidoreductase